MGKMNEANDDESWEVNVPHDLMMMKAGYCPWEGNVPHGLMMMMSHGRLMFPMA